MSFGLVTPIITAAPMVMTMLRRVKEAEEPTTICTSVVSALRRESSSPVRVRSKNSGRQAQYVTEHLAAHVGDHALTDPGHKVIPARRGKAHDDHDGKQAQKIAAHLRRARHHESRDR